jgi:flagellar biogenesis protein FliO
MFGRPRTRGPARDRKPNSEELLLTIVGILVVIILVLLAIYLFQRVRTR